MNLFTAISMRCSVYTAKTMSLFIERNYFFKRDFSVFGHLDRTLLQKAPKGTADRMEVRHDAA